MEPIQQYFELHFSRFQIQDNIWSSSSLQIVQILPQTMVSGVGAKWSEISANSGNCNCNVLSGFLYICLANPSVDIQANLMHKSGTCGLYSCFCNCFLKPQSHSNAQCIGLFSEMKLSDSAPVRGASVFHGYGSSDSYA